MRSIKPKFDTNNMDKTENIIGDIRIYYFMYGILKKYPFMRGVNKGHKHKSYQDAMEELSNFCTIGKTKSGHDMGKRPLPQQVVIVEYSGIGDTKDTRIIKVIDSGTKL